MGEGGSRNLCTPLKFITINNLPAVLVDKCATDKLNLKNLAPLRWQLSECPESKSLFLCPKDLYVGIFAQRKLPIRAKIATGTPRCAFIKQLPVQAVGTTRILVKCALTDHLFGLCFGRAEKDVLSDFFKRLM